VHTTTTYGGSQVFKWNKIQPSRTEQTCRYSPAISTGRGNVSIRSTGGNRLLRIVWLSWGQSLIKEFSVELGLFDDLRQTNRYFSTSNTFGGGVTEKDKGIQSIAANRLFSY